MATVQTGIATEFITFTRASNATVTDSDGLVKWAPHNLLTNSESFDAASWTKGNGGVGPPAVTANNVVAPNGTQTADRIVLPAVGGVNANSIVIQQPTQAFSTPHTASVYLRGDVGGEVVWIGYTPDAVTYTSTQCTLTTSWQLFTVNYTTSASGTQYFLIGVDLRDASQSAKGAQTIYAWGASLYRSDLGGMQPNTSAYPLYNPTTPKNLLGYTQDFSNAAWSKPAGTTTINPNQATAPDGTTTADLVTAIAGTAFHYFYQTNSASGSVTATIYAKAGTANWLGFGSGYTNGTETAWFNLSTGTCGAVAAGGTSTMTDAGNDWWRCSHTRSSWTGGGIIAFITNANSATAFNALGTETIYAWGAQLSDSASLDSYVPVYGAAVTSAAYYGPRRDFDPVTLACKGLLVEEQRANLLLYSAQFDVSANWSAFAGVSVSANSTTSPDGTLTADTVTSTAGNQIQQSGIATTIGITYTTSVWVKKTVGATIFPMLSFVSGSSDGSVILNTNTGVANVRSGVSGATNLLVVNAANYWRLSFATVANSTSSIMAFYAAASTDGTSYTGALSASQIFWGAQLEANASFATSYIPTGATSAGATRNADVASVSTQAFPYSATEGTVVVNFIRPTNTANAHAISFTATNSNTAPAIVVDNLSGGVRTLYYDGTTVSPDGSQTSVGAAGTIVKAALGYKSADTARSINGGTVATSSASLSTVSFTTMRIGDSPAMQNPINGHIRQITYLPRRISNADLVTRST